MTPVVYKYNSTKKYTDAFPCAYRQWRADDKPGNVPGCNKLHGYAFTMTFYFGTNDLDARNWVVDYGSLRPLKDFLEDHFDHTLIVASDDPEIEIIRELGKRKIAKVVELPNLGCEAIADMLYRYINAIFIPEQWGDFESKRIWCYRVEVQETQANMAFREGHREWQEDLLE